MMRHVNHIGFLHLQPVGKSNGLVDGLVGGVRLMPQTVDHHVGHPLEQPLLAGVDGLHVGDVGKASDAVGHDGEFSVINHHGQHFHTVYLLQHAWLHLLEVDARHSWVTAVFGCETVRDALDQVGGAIVVGIDAALTQAQTAQMVAPEDGVLLADDLHQGLDLAGCLFVPAAEGLLGEIQDLPQGVLDHMQLLQGSRRKAGAALCHAGGDLRDAHGVVAQTLQLRGDLEILV